jgi:hypothetical protein
MFAALYLLAYRRGGPFLLGFKVAEEDLESIAKAADNE